MILTLPRRNPHGPKRRSEKMDNTNEWHLNWCVDQVQEEFPAFECIDHARCIVGQLLREVTLGRTSQFEL